MAAGNWHVFARAKKYICNGTVTLGAGVFRMCLCRASASAALAAGFVGLRSTWASVGSEISAQGGYAAGGRSITPAGGKWTVGASARQYRFTFTTAGIVFTASGAPLNNLKYAVIRNSTGGGAGYVLCYVTLSSAAFTVASPNTLTIEPSQPAGIFTMA